LKWPNLTPEKKENEGKKSFIGSAPGMAALVLSSAARSDHFKPFNDLKL